MPSTLAGRQTDAASESSSRSCVGRLRDLQSEYTEDTVQRVAAESSNLKRPIRELTDDNRALTDKLQAARTNNRFLDKHIADMEAQLLDLDRCGQ
jgi:septal ring factor EnvC (AmiA/AmiB activator)